MHLNLSNCTVRNWQPHDELALAKHANNYNVWINLRNSFPHPYTLQDAQNWIMIASASKPVTNFAIVVNEEAVGGIGLIIQPDVYCKSAEVGYWLGEKYWNQGIVTEALQAITQYGFHTLELERIYAGVFAWNLKSTRVLERAGYRLEDRLYKSVLKDGKLIDSLLYAHVKPAVKA